MKRAAFTCLRNSTLSMGVADNPSTFYLRPVSLVKRCRSTIFKDIKAVTSPATVFYSLTKATAEPLLFLLFSSPVSYILQVSLSIQYFTFKLCIQLASIVVDCGFFVAYDNQNSPFSSLQAYLKRIIAYISSAPLRETHTLSPS